jgi:hypothetical protein
MAGQAGLSGPFKRTITCCPRAADNTISEIQWRSAMGWGLAHQNATPQTAVDERTNNMTLLFAQGDLLIERVADVPPSGTLLATGQDGAMVLAEGEMTGHRHAIFDRVTMFRDDALARDIPTGLYVGHVNVEGPSARLEHQEHDAVTLPKGTYRVRRQRELEPRDARIVAD